MEDTSHLLQYRRFFGTLFSVLPGLELVYGLSALLLYLLADTLMMDWGWAVGVAAIAFVVTFGIWLFVGTFIQRWVEDKSGTLLFILNLPFLVVLLGFLGWLFVATVINAEGPGSQGGHGALTQPLVTLLG